MRRKCDLCNRAATSYCESDDASLCWACDASVHRANFLAAKHSRVVLCVVCQEPTRWTGSGVQMDPVDRACASCIGGAGDDDDDGMSDDSCTAEEESDDDDVDDQVVPTPINKSA